MLSALVANFALVPLSAYIITRAIPLNEPFTIGLLLLATASGAPIFPKLVEYAHGDIALAVGLMAHANGCNNRLYACCGATDPAGSAYRDLGDRKASSDGGAPCSGFWFMPPCLSKETC